MRPFPVSLRRSLLTSSLRQFALTSALIAFAFLPGCGQGGGSAGSDDQDTAGQTGSVSIFLTDAPGDAFDRILLDIEGITLIGGGPQVTIFEGSETIDLLDLENFSDLFVHADEVPARTYKKVRLKVSRIRLVKEGDDAEVIEVDPPANGKIDLLASEGIEVRPGVDCVIEIDMDARESVDQNGNGRYRFRPVVKIDVRHTLAPRKLARVHGQVRRVYDDRNFVLCPTLFMASRDVLESREREEEGGIGDRRRCLLVELDDRTGVFDENGLPSSGGELERGDRVTVVGRYHLVDRDHDVQDDVDPMEDEEGEDAEFAAALGDDRIEREFEHRHHLEIDDDEVHDDDDDDGDEDDDGGRPRPRPVKLVLLAFVIEQGPPGTFLRLKGTTLSEVSDDGAFDFAIAPTQGFGNDSEVTALVQEGTRLFSRRGFEVRPGVIVPDLQALIDGVFAFEAGGASALRSALILLNLERPMPETVRGEITDIEAAQRRLFVDVEPDSTTDERNACVDVLEGARILIVRENSEETRSEAADFDDLEVGMRIRAYGEAGGNDCLQAKSLIAFDAPPPAVECERNGECDRSQYCAKPEGRCDGEGVCTVRPQVCPLYFDPVCGCDGETYGNACEAANAGANVAHEGACEPEPIICGGFPGTPCPDGMLCQYRDGECNIADNTGECVEEPNGCPEIYDPVCGCDGETYGNRCEALVAGARIDREGACEPKRCGGIAGFECDAGEICVFEDGVCISDAMGVCEPAQPGCPRIYQPVCGCDGETYANECEARQAQVAIQHRGACEDDRACGGELDVVCSEGHFCRAEPGDCRENAPGQCTRRPEACIDVWLPVCGCDGQTYGNGCEASAAGVTVQHPGPCEDPCDVPAAERPSICNPLPSDDAGDAGANVEVLQQGF